MQKNSIILYMVVIILKIDLTKLIYNNLYQIPISEEFTVPCEMLNNTEIKKISSLKVSGFISNNEEEYDLDIKVTGTMVLACARTLKDVEYPFCIDIDEIIDENNDKSLKIIQNRVDIFPIIWQYILADVPLRVLHPDAKQELVEGPGWRLITEDEQGKVIDPRLAKLKDYIKE